MWSLEQPEWHCKIDEGSIGLVSSRWSPDGRHILNTTEFNVSMAVGGVSFAPCQLLLAINKDLKITDSPCTGLIHSMGSEKFKHCSTENDFL